MARMGGDPLSYADVAGGVVLHRSEGREDHTGSSARCLSRSEGRHGRSGPSMGSRVLRPDAEGFGRVLKGEEDGAAPWAAPNLFVLELTQLLNRYAHTSSRAFDDTRGRLGRVRAQVRHFFFDDSGDLRLGDGAHLRLFRLARALLEPKRFQDKARGRRILHDEGERTVIVDRKLNRDDAPLFIFGRLVKLGNELADFYARGAERGAHRWRGRSRATRDLEFYLFNYRCHGAPTLARRRGNS